MIDVMFGIVGAIVGLPILACTLVVMHEFIIDLKELNDR